MTLLAFQLERSEGRRPWAEIRIILIQIRCNHLRWHIWTKRGEWGRGWWGEVTVLKWNDFFKFLLYYWSFGRQNKMGGAGLLELQSKAPSNRLWCRPGSAGAFATSAILRNARHRRRRGGKTQKSDARRRRCDNRICMSGGRKTKPPNFLLVSMKSAVFSKRRGQGWCGWWRPDVDQRGAREEKEKKRKRSFPHTKGEFQRCFARESDSSVVGEIYGSRLWSSPGGFVPKVNATDSFLFFFLF